MRCKNWDCLSDFEESFEPRESTEETVAPIRQKVPIIVAEHFGRQSQRIQTPRPQDRAA